MNAPTPEPQNVTTPNIIATVPTRAEQNGGEGEPRSESGQIAETHDDLCDRYAVMSELDYNKCRDDEAHRLRIKKTALDSLRKEGLQRAKDRAKAQGQEQAEPKQRRLSDDEMAEARSAIESIADLDGLALSRGVADIAERWGIAAADIRAELRSIQKKRAEETGSKSGGLEVAFDDPEPWDDPVDGRSLLTEIRNVIADNMDLPPHVAELCALWIAHTYCYRLFDHSIRLGIMSPQPRCGKTRLQDLMALMVWRPKQSANMSPAVMFRLVAHYGVTLIIDEVDTHLAGPNANPETRGILNAGHGRSGCVDRCEGDDNKVVSFPCFGPVVLGGIGKLPQTIADRSALIWLERKSKERRLDRIDWSADQWPRIQRQLRRWIDDSYDALAKAKPDIPDELSDRQADGWRALLSIAKVAGGEWTEKGRAAAIAISGASPDTETVEVQALADIFELFHENKGTPEQPEWKPVQALERSSGKYVPRPMASKDIAEGLNRLIDRPWPEWKGKGLTSASLSHLLKRFRIGSRQLGGKPGVVSGNPHGYEYEQFQPVWARYLDSSRYNAKSRRNPPKTEKNETLETAAYSVSDFPGNPQESAGSSVIAVPNGDQGHEADGLPEQRPGDDGEMEVAL